MINPWLLTMQAMTPPNPCAPQKAPDWLGPWAAMMDPARNPWLAMSLAFGPMGWMAAMAAAAAPPDDEATETLVEDMPV